MFLLCFAVLVAVSSAAKVCKCEDEKVKMTDAFFESVEYSIAIDLLTETSYKVAHFFPLINLLVFPKNFSEKRISMNSPRFYRRMCNCNCN